MDVVSIRLYVGLSIFSKPFHISGLKVMDPKVREVKVNEYAKILQKYLPGSTVLLVSEMVIDLEVHLKITRSRKTRFGDYQSPTKETGHIITINHDMNIYAFLITLIHEMAHLTCFEKHKHNVKPHGKEWKQEFKVLMDPFLTNEVFPEDLLKIVRRYLYNPAASSCSDLSLYRALKLYNEMEEGFVLLEQLPEKAIFRFKKGNSFIKGELMRKRFKCIDLQTKRIYLVSPVAEVLPIT